MWMRGVCVAPQLVVSPGEVHEHPVDALHELPGLVSSGAQRALCGPAVELVVEAWGAG